VDDDDDDLLFFCLCAYTHSVSKVTLPRL
jgi:hypothetical protein